MDLIEVRQKINEVEVARTELKNNFKKELDRLDLQLLEANTVYKHLTSNLNLDYINIAESILYVKGSYTRSGEQESCVRDMIKWLSGIRERLSSPYQSYYGTKNYSSWSNQREDHEYGYGPKHGSIVFEIGFKKEVRKLAVELTNEQKNAMIYYLENLKKIQENKSA